MFEQPYGGYAPGYAPYQQYQQPRQMMNPQMQHAVGHDPWIIVQTMQQVEQVAVQPGQVAWIMVQNEPVFARREADRMGLITTEYCRFERFDPKAMTATQQQQPEYVTRAEFDQFVAEMKKEWGGEK